MLVELARSGVESGKLRELGDQERGLLEERLLVSEWYPFEPFERLLCAVHTQLLGGGDEAAIRLGEKWAEEMLNSIHNMFLVKGDPMRTIRGMARLWDMYFDFGRVSVTNEDVDAVEIVVEGYPSMTRCHGMVLLGWLRAGLALSGADLIDVHMERTPWESAGELAVRAAWRPLDDLPS